MSIEDDLKALILSRYRSIREFSIKIGLPQSTIDSILHRGILNAGIGKVLKICKALDISADKLAEGKIVSTEISLTNITIEEQKHLLEYRELDDAGRELVDSLIHKLHEQRSSKLDDTFSETSNC